MKITQECQPVTEKQLPFFFQNGQPLKSVLKFLQGKKFSAMAVFILFPHVPTSFPLTLQHLELVIEAVDGAEAELPGLLVLVVEAVEAERGGDTIALRGKRG